MKWINEQNVDKNSQQLQFEMFGYLFDKLSQLNDKQEAIKLFTMF